MSKRISRPYASSLLTVAEKKHQTRGIKKDMELIYHTCNNNRNLLQALKSPVISIDKKMGIIKSLFENRVDELTIRFLMLVCKKNRAYCIPNIAQQVIDMYHKKKNMEKVKVCVAHPISEGIKNKLMEIISKITTKEILLDIHISADLIGGFLIQIEGDRWDFSVKHQLFTIKRALLR